MRGGTAVRFPATLLRCRVSGAWVSGFNSLTGLAKDDGYRIASGCRAHFGTCPPHNSFQRPADLIQLMLYGGASCRGAKVLEEALLI